MRETKYTISEAAKLLEVENHVLRYWEEELELNIPRNELGHRYYREEEIQLLHCIKELKNKGFQLKAVKEVLPDLEAKKLIDVHKLLATQQELENMENQEEKRRQDEQPQSTAEKNGQEIQHAETGRVAPHIHGSQKTGSGRQDTNQNFLVEDSGEYGEGAQERRLSVSVRTEELAVRNREEKMQEFEDIMGRIVGRALRENAGNLGDAMGNHLCDRMLREVDELMMEREEKEELRFRKLDEAIRSTQKARQEIAAAKDGNGRKKSLFFRKHKRKV